MKWLKENGCPWSQRTFYAAYKKEGLDFCALWVLDIWKKRKKEKGKEEKRKRRRNKWIFIAFITFYTTDKISDILVHCQRWLFHCSLAVGDTGKRTLRCGMKQEAIGAIRRVRRCTGIHIFRFYRFLKHRMLNFLSHFFLYDTKWQRSFRNRCVPSTLLLNFLSDVEERFQ